MLNLPANSKGVATPATPFRLSKKSRKVWAFSSFYGIIILVMKDDGKGL